MRIESNKLWLINPKNKFFCCILRCKFYPQTMVTAKKNFKISLTTILLAKKNCQKLLIYVIDAKTMCNLDKSLNAYSLFFFFLFCYIRPSLKSSIKIQLYCLPSYKAKTHTKKEKKKKKAMKKLLTFKTSISDLTMIFLQFV